MLSITHFCIYAMIINITMLKPIQLCSAHVHVEISHAKDYHVYEQIYTIIVSVVSQFYTITFHTCLTFIIVVVYFYYLPFVYIICILYILALVEPS